MIQDLKCILTGALECRTCLDAGQTCLGYPAQDREGLNPIDPASSLEEHKGGSPPSRDVLEPSGGPKKSHFEASDNEEPPGSQILNSTNPPRVNDHTNKCLIDEEVREPQRSSIDRTPAGIPSPS